MFRRFFIVTAVALLSAACAAPLRGQWYKSYQDGLDAIHSQQWQEAVTKLNDAIADKPESKARARTYGLMNFVDYFPYVYRGLAYYRLGNEQKALEDFEKEDTQGEVRRGSDDRDAAKILSDNLALLKKSTVADAKFEQGRSLYKQGNYQKAIDAFKEVPKSSASWSAASKYIEMAQAELNKTASRTATASPKQQKQQIEAGNREGIRLFNRKSYDAAEEKFNAVLALDAGNASARNYLARIKAEKEKHATERRQEPVASSGGAGETAEQAGVREAVQLFDSGFPSRAKEKFLALQGAGSSAPEIETYLGKIGRLEERARQGIAAYFAGKNLEAIETLNEVTRANSEDSRLYAALACAYATKFLLAGGEDKELYRAALETFRKAKQMDGNIRLDAAYISPKVIALLNPR